MYVRNTLKNLCFKENLFYSGNYQKNGILYAEFIDGKSKHIYRKIYKGKPYYFIKYKGIEYYFV